MKALTVRQPWAWAIAEGHKPVENRGWAASYRGPLAIHAGLSWDKHGEVRFAQIVHRLGIALPDDDVPTMGFGVVVAIVDLVGVCEGGACDCGPWAEWDAKHWQFENARPLATPAPARGRLQLWNVDLGSAA
jgi:hypothetical protein